MHRDDVPMDLLQMLEKTLGGKVNFCADVPRDQWPEPIREMVERIEAGDEDAIPVAFAAVRSDRLTDLAGLWLTYQAMCLAPHPEGVPPKMTFYAGAHAAIRVLRNLGVAVPPEAEAIERDVERLFGDGPEGFAGR